MKHPETIVSEIVALMTSTSFEFYYGRTPDQNFGQNDSDEDIEAPACFMDALKDVDAVTRITNVREYKIPLSLFWAFEADMNNIKQSEKLTIKNSAWAAAREFVLRLRKYEDDDVIFDRIEKESLTDVEGVFDLHLNGVLQELTIVLKDNASTCVS